MVCEVVCPWFERLSVRGLRGCLSVVCEVVCPWSVRLVVSGL